MPSAFKPYIGWIPVDSHGVPVEPLPPYATIVSERAARAALDWEKQAHLPNNIQAGGASRPKWDRNVGNDQSLGGRAVVAPSAATAEGQTTMMLRNIPNRYNQ